MKTDFIKANFIKNYGIEERSLKETEVFEKRQSCGITNMSTNWFFPLLLGCLTLCTVFHILVKLLNLKKCKVIFIK